MGLEDEKLALIEEVLQLKSIDLLRKVRICLHHLLQEIPDANNELLPMSQQSGTETEVPSRFKKE